MLLTPEGRRRVERDTVLDHELLATALAELAQQDRDTLLAGLARLATTAEATAPSRTPTARA